MFTTTTKLRVILYNESCIEITTQTNWWGTVGGLNKKLYKSGEDNVVACDQLIGVIHHISGVWEHSMR